MSRDSKKLSQAFIECMTELYAKSTPSADFTQLLQEAELNESGEKVVNFNSYELDGNEFDSIVSKYSEKYKLKGYLLSSFNFNIYLGPSPKIKSNRENQNL